MKKQPVLYGAALAAVAVAWRRANSSDVTSLRKGANSKGITRWRAWRQSRVGWRTPARGRQPGRADNGGAGNDGQRMGEAPHGGRDGVGLGALGLWQQRPEERRRPAHGR